jgi:hypothetical protein
LRFLRQDTLMQQDQIEVLFCDLCGASVPLADLERGAAIRHQAKTIGACCLAVLRQGDSPLAHPGSPAVPAPAGKVAASDGRVLPIAVLLLAGLAASTIFLDQRIGRLDETVRTNHDQVQLAQRSDSDVLQGVGVAMDAVARKADVEALLERLTAFDSGLQVHQEQVRQQIESLRQGLATVQQESQKLAAATVDYRPRFDELGQKLQRALTAMADLRTVPAPAPEVPPPAESSAPAPGAVDSVPEALAVHVRRLTDADAAVRFEAVDALIASKNPAVLKALLPMARDADAFVRRLTIDGLRDFKHPDAVEALLAALMDGETTVAETAWNSLKKLTGQKIPFDAAASSKEARLRAQQRWQEWWDKNKATFGS